MDAMINGRTPEEIKTAIAQCYDGVCGGCAYFDSHSCEYEKTKDTLALIERLESERDAALSKVPKWISVEERLPEKPGEYGAYASGMHLVLGFDENGDWFDEEYFNYNESITHWMPLPEPPEEERE